MGQTRHRTPHVTLGMLEAQVAFTGNPPVPGHQSTRCRSVDLDQSDFESRHRRIYNLCEPQAVAWQMFFSRTFLLSFSSLRIHSVSE